MSTGDNSNNIDPKKNLNINSAASSIDEDTSPGDGDPLETFVLESDLETPTLESELDDTFVLEKEENATRNFPGTFSATATVPNSANNLPTRLSDLALIAIIVTIVYGFVSTTGRLFSAVPYESLEISTSLSVLPWYAAQSLTRMIAGYFVSLLFAIVYAYVAYRVEFVAQAAMLVIDVLQSIPLLSFLPGVVLGLISVFPGSRIGVEFASVLLLFTSMAWNMLLGFYQSLKGIPRDLIEVSTAFKLSPWKRFWTLELPAGAIGLIWNSVISVAGGWFFLISIESFELGNQDFRLPGLGSFLAAAAQAADYQAILAALAVVIAVIIAVDFCIWQPLIAWSAKYNYGGDSTRSKSAVLRIFQTSSFFRYLHAKAFAPAWEKFVSIGEENYHEKLCNVDKNRNTSNKPTLKNGYVNGLACTDSINANGSGNGNSILLDESPSLASQAESGLKNKQFLTYLVQAAACATAFAGVCISVMHAWEMVKCLSWSVWADLASASLFTFGRVFIALAFSLLWTVPAGVAIGRNQELSSKIQPIVQIAASVPATALFPFVLLFLAQLGGGLQIGSIALMMLGTMWYVLFNVIAGAQAIPAELFEVDYMYNKMGRFQRWKNLILPGIFPYLITGIVTAVGGAWNASIVSEYVVFQGGILKTHGLGSLISQAAAAGNYPLLLAATVVMSVLVLLTNRLVWGPLYRLAENKYRI